MPCHPLLAAICSAHSCNIRDIFALAQSYRPRSPAPAVAAFAPCDQLPLDFNWKFFPGHASDPYRRVTFAESGSFDFATEKFDDSK
jgi:hypothetical protein